MSAKPSGVTLPAPPSRRLLRAAVAGLLSASVGACSSPSSPGPDAPASPNEKPSITSSKPAGVLTEADFQALCDERGGTVEVLAHCGGLATAAGFSYDSSTETLSEHTCAGANTCGGWNCITDSKPPG